MKRRECIISILKKGDTLMFLKGKPGSFVAIRDEDGKKRHWANGDDKLSVKNEEEFYQLIVFISQGFGILFKKIKCFSGKGVLVYEVIGTEETKYSIQKF